MGESRDQHNADVAKIAGGLSPASPSPAIAYESRAIGVTRRPRWVIAVVAIYSLLFIALLLIPAMIAFCGGDRSELITSGICVTALILSGLALMIVPVRVVRRRPVTRRTIWIPILASGALVASMVLSCLWALSIYFASSQSDAGFGPSSTIAILATFGLVWTIWSVLFLLIAFRRGPESVGLKLHKMLVAGSVLELLIAVPVHIAVRRRNWCCAEIVTGTAIATGVAIMFISLGPSVLLLFYQRRRRLLGLEK